MVAIALVASLFFGVACYALLKVIGPGGSLSRLKLFDKRISASPASSVALSGLSIKKRTYVSDVQWIENLLKHLNITYYLSNTLKLLRIKVSVSVFLLICIVLTAISYAFLYKMFTIFGAIPFALLIGGAPILFVRMMHKRYVQKFNEYFPNALSVLASSIKVGHVLERGIDAIIKTAPFPVSDEFRIVQGEMQLGIALGDALDNMHKRVGGAELKIMVTGIAINQELGGNLSEILNNIEKTIRERFALDREAKTLSAQGRLTAIVLACIPLFIGQIYYSQNKEIFMEFMRSEPGKMFLFISISIYVITLFWIKSIIKLKD